MEKICTKCVIKQDINSFFKDKTTSDGYSYICKNCKNKYKKQNHEMILKSNKKYYLNNKEKIDNYIKNYEEKNKEKVKSYRDQYYYDHKEKHNEKSREWAKNNPEKVKQNIKRYNNSENGKQYQEIYKEKNYENIKIYRRGYKRKQLQDPLERIKANLRNRVYKMITNETKSAKSLELLGCNDFQYKEYLESKFTPNMSWSNYGKVWEIDHIKPCAKFDLTDPEQQKQCFHYTNTQPLLIFDNRSKGTKYL